MIPVAVPPLRERPDDIPDLVRHFSVGHRVRTGGALPEWSSDAVEALERYQWPGNIRELANIVERLAILHAGHRVTAREVAQVLPVSEVRGTLPTALPSPADLGAPRSEMLAEYERLLIARALAVSQGNIA